MSELSIDEYEGHSEGKWYWSPDGLRCETHLVYPSYRNILWNGTPPHPPKDMKLIADAPLILQALIDERAEVKRLRKALLLIADTANGRPFVSGHIGLPFVHEVFKELIE